MLVEPIDRACREVDEVQEVPEAVGLVRLESSVFRFFDGLTVVRERSRSWRTRGSEATRFEVLFCAASPRLIRDVSAADENGASSRVSCVNDGAASPSVARTGCAWSEKPFRAIIVVSSWLKKRGSFERPSCS